MLQCFVVTICCLLKIENTLESFRDAEGNTHIGNVVLFKAKIYLLSMAAVIFM